MSMRTEKFGDGMFQSLHHCKVRGCHVGHRALHFLQDHLKLGVTILGVCSHRGCLVVGGVRGVTGELTHRLLFAHVLCVCCDRCRCVRGVVRSSRGHGDESHEQVERASFLMRAFLWI